jgi:hypothetical protein
MKLFLYAFYKNIINDDKSLKIPDYLPYLITGHPVIDSIASCGNIYFAFA